MNKFGSIRSMCFQIIVLMNLCELRHGCEAHLAKCHKERSNIAEIADTNLAVAIVVSEAQTVLEESAKSIKDLRSKVALLEKNVSNLHELMRKYEDERGASKGNLTMRRIEKLAYKMSRRSTKIQIAISDVKGKCKVRTTIATLTASVRSEEVALTMNALLGCTNIMRINNFWATGSPILISKLQSLTDALFLSTVANVHNIMGCRKTISSLEIHLEIVRSLQMVLDKVESLLDQAEGIYEVVTSDEGSDEG